MTSTDREILLSINGQLQTLNERVTRIEETVALMVKDIDALDRRIMRIDDRIENLQHSVYWIFAAIGIFLAAVAVIPSLTARKPEPPKDDKVSLTLSQFGALITDRLLESRKGDPQ